VHGAVRIACAEGFYPFHIDLPLWRVWRRDFGHILLLCMLHICVYLLPQTDDMVYGACMDKEGRCVVAESYSTFYPGHNCTIVLGSAYFSVPLEKVHWASAECDPYKGLLVGHEQDRDRCRGYNVTYKGRLLRNRCTPSLVSTGS
jgi:hypothetical protein